MEIPFITKLIENGRLTTPSYIFDYDVLSKHVEKMLQIANNRVEFCYAMKANPFLTEHLAKYLGKIEVCSPGELQICNYMGIAGSNIVFSGVNKTKQDVEAAFHANAAIITIESAMHFELIREYCEQHDVSVHVYLRLTSGLQFGMDEKQVEEIIHNREEYPYIIIDGLHFFSGTQKKKADKIYEELGMLEQFAAHLDTAYGYHMERLEYGAGLSVPYFQGEDFAGIYQNLEQLINYIEDRQYSFAVTLELGRYIAFSCGQYITQVVDCKKNHDRHYCIVDGGIHQLGYHGQNMAMRVPIIEHIAMGESFMEPNIMEGEQTQRKDGITEEQTWEVCGSLCTFADVLVKKMHFCDLRQGDFLVFENAGAYAVTESPGLFLSRTMPVIYSYSGETGLEVMRNAVESYQWNCDMRENR